MRITGMPRLHVDPETLNLCNVGVIADEFGPERMPLLRRYLQAGGSTQALLCVHVVQPGSVVPDDLPSVAGHYALLDDGLRFLPAFPFERATSYRACLCMDALAEPGRSGTQAEDRVVDFAFAASPHLPGPQVQAIFPSAPDLPANLLRFYVMFSKPMQRGAAKANIALLNADGAPVADALYNAPVELWDRKMQCLTVLLDPGRLKRGVGPNRALGPPLAAGQHYTLMVGAGMRDTSGSLLADPVFKRFRVIEALRSPILVDCWQLATVKAGKRTVLAVTFPDPLDWALLSHAITVETADGARIAGTTTTYPGETRWEFTPDMPWAGGAYCLRVASYLEDVCGNTVAAPFDRPLRPADEMQAPGPSVIAFRVDQA